MNNKVSVGCYITIPSEIVAEIFSNLPYDFLVVDLEHSIITIHEAQNIIRVANLSGKEVLVRLSDNKDETQIKRVLDAGADGIIVPMVNTVDDAMHAIESSYYPPLGKRGVGLARAQLYGEKFNQNLERLQKKKIKIIVQFEDVKVVDSVEKILGLEEIDGFMIGPYDFTASMNIHGKFDDKGFLEEINKINEINKKYKKLQGFHLIEPDPKDFSKLIEKNYNFIVYSIDTKHLLSSAKKIF